jgi:hypothetical protein
VRWRVFTFFATLSFTLGAVYASALVRSYFVSDVVRYGERDHLNGVWQRQYEFSLNSGRLGWASRELDERKCEWNWSRAQVWASLGSGSIAWAFSRRSEVSLPLENFGMSFYAEPTTMPTGDPRRTRHLEDVYGEHKTTTRMIRVPMQPFLAIFCILPFVWLRRFVSRQHQIARGLAGLCPQCGYNIVKTTRQCPECGFTFQGT